MRHPAALFLTAALLSQTLPATAETLSAEIGRAGLAATQARLAALPALSDADRFALGGVTFLRAIEGSFQQRWAMGLTDRTGMLPLLRLPLADNPNPTPFDPQVIATIFQTAEGQLREAQETLTQIPDTADFGVEIALSDIWFDVNSDGARTAGEGIGDILGLALTGGDAAMALPTVRFDVADAAWTAAYADLLAGFCGIVLAYDPTEPITRVLSARAAMAELGPVQADPFLGGGSNPDAIDMIAILLARLDQTPDAARLAAAKQHFLSMVAQNRLFWTRVASETDNDREWLPNDAQQSSLGIPVPPGTGAVWLTVLADLESVLTGAKLVPYWRVGGSVGVDVGAMFDDPRPVDLAGWVQGWAALPYLKQGPLIGTDSLNAFDSLTSGQAMLFAIYLN